MPIKYMISCKQHDMWEVHEDKGYYYIPYWMGRLILKQSKHVWKGRYVHFINE